MTWRIFPRFCQTRGCSWGRRGLVLLCPPQAAVSVAGQNLWAMVCCADTRNQLKPWQHALV